MPIDEATAHLDYDELDSSSALRTTTMTPRDHETIGAILGSDWRLNQPPACGDAMNLRCSRWGSNPHWDGFKPSASADWATGAASA